MSRVVLLPCLVVSGCCFQMPTPTPPSHPTSARFTGLASPTGDWTVPTGNAALGAVLKAGVGEGPGAREVLTLETLQAAGGQGGDTRHVSFNFRLEGPPAGRWPFRATLRTARDGRLLNAMDEGVSFESTTFGVAESGGIRFILCPSLQGVNLLGQPLRLDAWIPTDGGVPDAGVLARTSAEFSVQCFDGCEEACGG